jgi:hypothetical protein
MIDFLGDGQYTNSLRTVAGAVATAGAENLSEFLGID